MARIRDLKTLTELGQTPASIATANRHRWVIDVVQDTTTLVDDAAKVSNEEALEILGNGGQISLLSLVPGNQLLADLARQIPSARIYQRLKLEMDTLRNEWQARMAEHIAADDLIQGIYWQNGKGCFIGCSVHGRDPQILTDEIGLPLTVIRIAEAIFEGLPAEDAKDFARDISDPTLLTDGKDVSLVGWKFLLWLNTDAETFPAIHHETVAPAIQRVVDEVLTPLASGEPVTESAARSAAWSAGSAAGNAARSAESAAQSAEGAAWSAVWSAVWSAASLARSAVWSAASLARSAERLPKAQKAVESAYARMARELLTLLRAA